MAAKDATMPPIDAGSEEIGGELKAVSSVQSSAASGHDGNAGSGRRHNQEHHSPQQNLTSDEIERPLARAVEIANSKMKLIGKPHRLELQRDGKQLILECRRRNASGTFTVLFRKEISGEDFIRWVEDLSSGEGVLFDTSG